MSKGKLRLVLALICAFALCLVLPACGGGEAPGGTEGSGGIEDFVGFYQATGGFEADQEFDEAYMEELRDGGYNLMLCVEDDQITLVTPNGTAEIDDFEVGGDGTVSFGFDSSWTGNPEPAALSIDGDEVVLDYTYDGEECQAVFEPISQDDYDGWVQAMAEEPADEPEGADEPTADLSSYVGFYQTIGGYESGTTFTEEMMAEQREEGYNTMVMVTEEVVAFSTPNGSIEITQFTPGDGGAIEFEFDASWQDDPKPASIEHDGDNIVFSYEYDGEDCYAILEPISQQEYESWL